MEKIHLKVPVTAQSLADALDIDVSLLLAKLKKFGAPITVRKTTCIDPALAIRVAKQLGAEEVEVEGLPTAAESRVAVLKKEEEKTEGEEMPVPQDYFEELDSLLSDFNDEKELAISHQDFDRAAMFRDAGDCIRTAQKALKRRRSEPWPPAPKIKHMLAREMTVGRQYKLLREPDIKVVEYDRLSNSPPGETPFYIVHERGELDLQSCFGIKGDYPVQPVSEVSVDGKCPACDSYVLPNNNPDNPVCRRHKHYCNCGWMGD